MNTLMLLIPLLLLSACQTPKPIMNTAATVTKMSNEMHGAVSVYAKSLQSLRKSDAERLQGMRADADRRRSAAYDQIQIMTLSDEVRPVKVLASLAALPIPDPLHRGTTAAGLEPAASPLKFDGAPLKDVAKITADIAQPRSTAEQLKALLSFGQTVNDDLLEAAAKNETTAGK